MKNRFIGVLLLSFFLGINFSPALGADPFLSLRNEPETSPPAAAPEPDTPVETVDEVPDSPSVSPETDTSPPDTPVVVADTPESAASAGDTREEDSPPEQIAETEEIEEDSPDQSEENGAARVEEKTDEPQKPEPAQPPAPAAVVPELPAPQQPGRPEFLEPLASPFIRAEIEVGQADLFSTAPAPSAALLGPGPSPGWPWLKIIISAAVLFAFLFLYWLMRRPRRIKVFHHSSTNRKNEYYRQFMNKYSRVSSTITSPGGVNPSSISSAEKKDYPVWRYSVEELENMGIDPSYREVFKLYYVDGYDIKQIAEKTGYGIGEIGLVLDLARRERRTAS